MASERIEIWSEQGAKSISIKTEPTEKTITTSEAKIDILDNDYNDIKNKPSINDVVLVGNKTTHDLKLDTETIRLNEKIDALDNSLKKVAKTGSYNDLANRPSINGVTLTGNKTSADLHIEGGQDPEWGNIRGVLSNQTDLNTALNSKVPTSRTINSKALSQNITLTGEDIGAASADDLGCIKVGSGLSITDGVLSATGGGGNGGYNASWLMMGDTATQEQIAELTDAVQTGKHIYMYLDDGEYYMLECGEYTYIEGSHGEADTINLNFDSYTAEPHLGEDDSLYIALYSITLNCSTGAITVSNPDIDTYNFATKNSLSTVATSGDYDDLTDKPSVTYTGTSISSRVVTQQTVTEPVSGTKPIGSYGPFNYIPLDLSSYSSGAATKALLPEDHLPDGFYVITAEGYIRLGSDTKQLKPGTLLYWIDNEVYLIGYNACEYWSYDADNDTWEGGYFTTQTDVEYMIQQAVGTSWTTVSSGAFAVASKENGYYIFNYSSASGTGRRININVEGTATYYFPYNGTILIKSDRGVTMLGRESLYFEYDSTNSYYKSPVPIAPSAFTGTDGTTAGTIGYVPAPATTDQDKVLKSDGSWGTFTSGTPVSLNWTGAAGGSYTATSFGVITIQTAVAGTTHVDVFKNNVKVATVQGGGNSSYIWIPIILTVGNGDIIQATSSDNGGNAQIVANSCSFYALK